ncbi:serine O-acetyltransferase EpsC [Streptomyces sp. 12297]|uniref:serine O-acetyltransferase EpsC n=1 Tax=Streptomyces sp. NBC_00239 TaxID=2903640 RepID=UPI002E2E4345|nr:serine O-acetyltransferase EpsC [Streptomyces sp. NBC_00239]
MSVRSTAARRSAAGRALAAALREDLETVLARDPSVHSRLAAARHPALHALWAHRLAHRLHGRGLRGTAQLLAHTARRRTGVEIHPGAVLGRRVFIDHGAAVVIGETAVVGADVTIYHQVTLGAVGWWVDNERPAGQRRHPAVGDGVVLGAGASVLGPVTVGAGALIGAGATVVHDIEAGSRVYAPPSVVLPPHAQATPAEDLVRLHASAGAW